MEQPKSGRKDIDVFAQRHIDRDNFVTVHLKVNGRSYWRQTHDYEDARIEWYQVIGDPPFNIREDGKVVEDEKLFTLLEALYERCTGDEYNSGLP